LTERFLVPTALALMAISACAQARVDELPSTVEREESGVVPPGSDNSRDPPRQARQPGQTACASGDSNAVDLLRLEWRVKNCAVLRSGFSDISGSFVGLSYSTRNVLHLGETLSLGSEYGVRRRRMEFGFDQPSLFGAPIHAGLTVYGQRFQYNQARESSIFAFQRDIPAFNQFTADARLDYVSHSYGGTAFVEYPLRLSSSHVRLTYSYDVSDFEPLTPSTSAYFNSVHFPSVLLPDGIRTIKVIPSVSHDTLDDPIRPTHGTAFDVSMAVAGLGGDVNTIEPRVEAKHFRSGFKQSHVIGMRLLGRFLKGYNGEAAPPFDRYYMGGEEDIRGFDSWSISPIIYEPSATTVNVFNEDGSQRTLVHIINGVKTLVNVTQVVPSYRIVSSGGDTNVVMNIEYRIPVRRDLTLSLFTDAGVNRLSLPDQLRVSPGVIDRLNREFPQATFGNRPLIQPGTQGIRMSNGVELQLLVPKIKAPLRFYGAFNPVAYRGIVQAPLVVDRSYFQNNVTYLRAVNIVNAPMPLREGRFMFRFSIGRTFGGRT
jgi:outer membrane protein insertion porin family